jgi:hypothetical protein
LTENRIILNSKKTILQRKNFMDRFLVESPHTPDECLKTMQQILSAGYLTHFDWGCKSGEHCGWVIIEAENEAEAHLVVPAFLRGRARVIKLNKYTPEEIKALH